MRLIKDNVERVTEDVARIEKLKAAGFKPLYSESSNLDKTEEPSKDLGKMNLSELKSLAKEKGLDGYSSLSKDELMSVLKDVV